MMRKDQACWSAVGAKLGLLHLFIVGMFGIEAQFIRLSHPAAFDSIVATLPFWMPTLQKPRRRPPILGTVRDYLADQTVLSHTLRACIGCGKFGKLAARIFPLTRQPFHHS